MRVCIETHEVPGFGTVPEGSLWADDSPYIGADNAHLFVDVVDSKPGKSKSEVAR